MSQCQKRRRSRSECVSELYRQEHDAADRPGLSNDAIGEEVAVVPFAVQMTIELIGHYAVNLGAEPFVPVGTASPRNSAVGVV